MVAISQCPTYQPAFADWYRCATQNVSGDTPMTLKNLCGFNKVTMGHGKPAKSLVPHTPEGLDAAQARRCTEAPTLKCQRPRRSRFIEPTGHTTGNFYGVSHYCRTYARLHLQDRCQIDPYVSGARHDASSDHSTYRSKITSSHDL